MSRQVDVAIIGAGPAGITAAVQLVRCGLSVALFEKRKAGGTIEVAWRVENFPAFKSGVSGNVIAKKFASHLDDFDIEPICLRVKRITLGTPFRVETDAELFLADNVIVAGGLFPRVLQVPEDIKPFMLDLFTLPEKAESSVLVVGSGDVAFDQASRLAEMGHNVTLVHRKPKLQALERIVKLAEQLNIKRYISAKPEWLVKDGRLIRLDIDENICFDYVLPCIGREIDAPEIVTDSARFDLELQQGKILSAYDGLYFAGDIIRGKMRQVSVAMGDGMRAALTIIEKMAS